MGLATERQYTRDVQIMGEQPGGRKRPNFVEIARAGPGP